MSWLHTTHAPAGALATATIGTGPDARGPHLFLVEKSERSWLVQQIVDDPEGDHDWRISARVDLPASVEVGEPVLAVTSFAPLSALSAGREPS